jgi:hypothetical protein
VGRLGHELNKVLAILFFSLCFPAYAADYYVDFDSGADTNNGTATGTAFKHAPGDPNATDTADSTTLAAGDTVYFRGGVVYLGYVEITASGSLGNAITFDGNASGAWGTGRSIIDGEGEELLDAARAYGFYSPSGSDFILIDNFEIRNLRFFSPTEITISEWGVYFAGSGSSIEVRNCYLHDIMKVPAPVFTGGEFGVGDNPGTAVTTTTFSDSNVGLSVYAGTPGELTQYKILTGWNSSDFYRAWGYIGQAVDAVTVTIYKDIYLTPGNEGWNIGRDPVGNDDEYFYYIFDPRIGAWTNGGACGIRTIGHSDIYLHDNVIRNVRIGLQTIGSLAAPITNVNIYNNDISIASWGVNVTGVGSADIAVGVNIYGNNIHDFYEMVEYNWGWHNDGIYVWGDPTTPGGVRDVEIYNNFIYGDMRPGATGLLYMEYGIQDAEVYNNVFASFAGSGSQVRLNGKNSGIDDALLVNNIFAKAPGGSKTTMALSGATNLTIKNNIVYQSNSYGGFFVYTSESPDSIASNYNLINGVQDGAVVFDAVAYSLTDGGGGYPYWLESGIFDQNSVINQGDPLFESFPEFLATIDTTGTLSRLYFATLPVTDPVISFVEGDHIEYEYDGVVRTVSAVGADYIDVSPDLSEVSTSNEVILNWKAVGSFTYDLNIKEGSPAIDAGADLSAAIGNLDANGVTRPQGLNWDIGAYEYVEAPTPSSGDLVMIRSN